MFSHHFSPFEVGKKWLSAVELGVAFLTPGPWTFYQTLMYRAYPVVAGTALCTLVLAVIYVMFVARFVREIIWTGALAKDIGDGC